MNLIKRIRNYVGGGDPVPEARSLTAARVHAQRTITRTVHFGMELRESQLNIAEHSANVAVVAQSIAERMNISEPDAYVLQIAAELHEVGMYGIDPAVLLKPGPYSPEELRAVRAQAKVSAQVAGLMNGPRVARLIEYQYENYSEISNDLRDDPDQLLAGILRIADVTVAVTNPRPYQDPLSVHARRKLLLSGAGTRFHPIAVEHAIAAG